MDEYIKRKTVIDLFKHMGKPVEMAIKEIPPADVAPVLHGSWVFDSGNEYVDYYHCSGCGKEIELCCEIYSELKPNYCSNCGAKMDKET